MLAQDLATAQGERKSVIWRRILGASGSSTGSVGHKLGCWEADPEGTALRGLTFPVRSSG